MECHLVVVDAGRIAAAGDPSAVLTAQTVGSAFGLECVVAEDPVSRSPMIVPIGRYHQA